MIFLGDFDKQSEEIVNTSKIAVTVFPLANYSPRVVLGSIVSAIPIIKHHNQVVWMLVRGFQSLEEIKGYLQTMQVDVILVVFEHRLDRKLFRISLDCVFGRSSINKGGQVGLADCHENLGIDCLNTTSTNETGGLNTRDEIGSRLTF